MLYKCILYIQGDLYTVLKGFHRPLIRLYKVVAILSKRALLKREINIGFEKKKKKKKIVV